MTASKKWVKITIACPENVSEAVSDLLGVLSGAGVEIHPDSQTGLNEISGFFSLEELEGEPEHQDIDALKLKVANELQDLLALYNQSLPELRTETFDDQEWATSWQQYFKTFEIVPGLIIKPSWENFIPDEHQHVLEMDPGMAFGTGQHESTRLALSLLTTYLHENPGSIDTVLDVGTGTGILAMAAALFGAGKVIAIDNDPEAIAVAENNVLHNHLSATISVSGESLQELDGPFDLICANIVHDVLADMAPQIVKLLAPKSRLVLAGILSGGQEDNLSKIYAQHGIETVLHRTEGEWVALLLSAKN